MDVRCKHEECICESLSMGLATGAGEEDGVCLLGTSSKRKYSVLGNLESS